MAGRQSTAEIELRQLQAENAAMRRSLEVRNPIFSRRWHGAEAEFGVGGVPRPPDAATEFGVEAAGPLVVPGARRNWCARACLAVLGLTVALCYAEWGGGDAVAGAAARDGASCRCAAGATCAVGGGHAAPWCRVDTPSSCPDATRRPGSASSLFVSEAACRSGRCEVPVVPGARWATGSPCALGQALVGAGTVCVLVPDGGVACDHDGSRRCMQGGQWDIGPAQCHPLASQRGRGDGSAVDADAGLRGELTLHGVSGAERFARSKGRNALKAAIARAAWGDSRSDAAAGDVEILSVRGDGAGRVAVPFLVRMPHATVAQRDSAASAMQARLDAGADVPDSFARLLRKALAAGGNAMLPPDAAVSGSVETALADVACAVWANRGVAPGDCALVAFNNSAAGLRVGAAAACADACKTVAACALWTFNRRDTRIGSAAPNCWLCHAWADHTVNHLTPNLNRISGSRCGSHKRPAQEAVRLTLEFSCGHDASKVLRRGSRRTALPLVRGARGAAAQPYAAFPACR